MSAWHCQQGPGVNAMECEQGKVSRADMQSAASGSKDGSMEASLSYEYRRAAAEQLFCSRRGVRSHETR